MSEVILSAHQPNFLPYLGFFDKMKKSDIFVIRDEVLFTDSDYHHRNRIRISSNNINEPKFKWLTVPVFKLNDHIMHIGIKKEAKIKSKMWHEQMLHDIEANYKGTEYFEEFFPEIRNIIDNSHDKLLLLNMKVINLIKNLFGIKTKIILASELGLKPVHYCESDASEDLAKICSALGADVYLSGAGAKVYLDLNAFEERGIEVRFQEFQHPVYKQKYPGFIPNLSAIDALFCIGESALNKELIIER